MWRRLSGSDAKRGPPDPPSFSSGSRTWRSSVVFAVVAIVGCGKAEPSGPLPERAAEVFDRITVDTANGLSGLATDETGALWTVAERDEKAYRIRLDGTKPIVETF